MVAPVRETKEVAADALIVVATDVGVFAGLRSRERSPFDRSLGRSSRLGKVRMAFSLGVIPEAEAAALSAISSTLIVRFWLVSPATPLKGVHVDKWQSPRQVT